VLERRAFVDGRERVAALLHRAEALGPLGNRDLVVHLRPRGDVVRGRLEVPGDRVTDGDSELLGVEVQSAVGRDDDGVAAGATTGAAAVARCGRLVPAGVST